MEGLTKIVGDFVGKGSSVVVDLAVKCLRLFRQVTVGGGSFRGAYGWGRCSRELILRGNKRFSGALETRDGFVAKAGFLIDCGPYTFVMDRRTHTIPFLNLIKYTHII